MFYCTTTNPPDATLFHQAQAGDAVSLDHLMQQHDGLVHHIIRQQWSGPLTYASVAIARQVWRAVAQAARARGTPQISAV